MNTEKNSKAVYAQPLPEAQEGHFICPMCEQEFECFECAKELEETSEYLCQECYDIPE